MHSGQAHKNSKDKNKLYVRTKPSVIEREKSLLHNQPPKKVIDLIDEENGGLLSVHSSSDGPRDRRQLYNIKHKQSNKNRSRNTGPVTTPDFTQLIAEMDNGKFIKNIDFSFRSKQGRIHPNTFAMTENCVTWIKMFCSPFSSVKSQLGIDMTYKVGPFYTTCLSFPHPHFVHKDNKQCHPTIFAGMMTSTGRQEHDYRNLANQLKLCGITNLIYGTDGEIALEMGFERIFPIESKDQNQKNIKLRCFNHMKDDILKNLKKYNITKEATNEIIKDILGFETNGVRVAGLVDEDQECFENRYNNVSSTWPPQFKDYIESDKLKVRSLKSTFLKSMGKEVRTDAGLGNPPNKFDNQRAESINNVLKEATGGQYVAQSAVHDIIYTHVVQSQQNELIKAIYGCGEYRLSKDYEHFEISPQKWKSMTNFQRINYTNKVLQCKIPEENKQKVITRMLSIQPQDCTENLYSLPPTIVEQLWKNPEMMLSNDYVRELENGSFCIAEDDNAYIIKQNKNTFVCNCPDFPKLSLCPHALVIADEKSCLVSFISSFKYNPSAVINKHNVHGAGERKTKKPRKGGQNVKKNL